MNIRTRLTLLFVLLVASIMLLFTVSVYYLYDQLRQQEFEQRLEGQALTTIRLREDVGQVPKGDLPEISEAQVTLYSTTGEILYNLDSLRSRFPIPFSFLQKITPGKHHYVRLGNQEAVGVGYRNAKNEHLYIVASGFDKYGLGQLESLRAILFYSWLLSLAIVGVAGYLFATDALRPVAELIRQANAISATNIHMRLYVGRQRDELADLARTFNDLLSRLEVAFVSQKSFVSHASHELRTPLTVMMGHIEVTRLQARSNKDYEQALDGVLDEVKSMIRLVNGLLELARASSDTTMLNHKPVRIDELLWQAQSQIMQKKPEYQVNIDFDNMPEQEEEMVVIGEEPLLQTAFQNLIENGCKYSPDSTVIVLLSFNKGVIQITVRDQGYGIPEIDLPHIFEPFYRSNSTMTISGHGIGLALTKRIIELHQGKITVKSVVGQGTTFKVTLPTQFNAPEIKQLPLVAGRIADSTTS
jgi:signal transduction histidine kinase